MQHRQHFPVARALGLAVIATVLTGCGASQNAPTAKLYGNSEAVAQARSRTAEVPAEKNNAETSDNGAGAPDHAVVDGGENTGSSAYERGIDLVDDTVARVQDMIDEIEANPGDRNLVRSLASELKQFAAAQSAQSARLRKSLTPAERQKLREYAQSRLQRVMQKMIAVLSAQHGVAP